MLRFKGPESPDVHKAVWIRNLGAMREKKINTCRCVRELLLEDKGRSRVESGEEIGASAALKFSWATRFHIFFGRQV